MNAPPRIPRRRLAPGTLLLLLLLALVPLFLAVPIAWRRDPLIGPLGDRYHVVLFFVVTLVLHRWGPLKRRPWPVLAAAVVLGAATEGLQVIAGRSATLWDWSQDVLGAALAGCWIWWQRLRARRRRTPARIGLAALATVALLGAAAWPLRNLPAHVVESRAARARFPVLDDFERPNSLQLWGDDHARVRRVAVEGGGHAMQLEVDDTARWAGADNRALPFDWSGQDTLRLEVRLLDGSPPGVALVVVLDDRAGRRDRGRLVHRVPLRHPADAGGRWQPIAIPLDAFRERSSGRPLHRPEVLGVALVPRHEAGGPVRLQVDDLRLVPARDAAGGPGGAGAAGRAAGSAAGGG